MDSDGKSFQKVLQIFLGFKSEFVLILQIELKKQQLRKENYFFMK